MFPALSYGLIVLATSWLYVGATAHAADEIKAPDCANMTTLYYPVDVQNIAGVSGFYERIGQYFEGLKDFEGVAGRRHRTLTYFDFPDFRILAGGKELLHRVDQSLPVYRAEREQIIYRDVSIPNAVNTRTFEVRNYSKKAEPLDKHPFFGKLSRKERPALITELRQLDAGLSPASLAPNIQVEQDDIVYLITHHGVPQSEIVLSKFHISDYGMPNTHMLLKLERFIQTDTQLTPEEERRFGAAFCTVIQDLHQRFPVIKGTPWFGYADFARLAADQLPSRIFFRKHAALYKAGQILVLSGIGFLILSLLLGRYSRKNVYRLIAKPGVNRNEQ